MGSPSNPVDPRRRVGSHRRLKDILLGTAETRASRDPWARFSGAMDRQSLEEALAALGEEQLELVGLAYFEGRTNKAIADRLGLSVATVQRRLRAAISTMSRYLRERGAGTWGLVGGTGILASRRWRSWLETWHLEPLQAPVRELAQVAAGAIVVVTVVSAGTQVVSSHSRAPSPTPAHSAPNQALTEGVVTATPADPQPATSTTTPAVADQTSPVDVPDVSSVGPHPGSLTATAGQAVTSAATAVGKATGVKLPSPPPLP